MKKGLRYKNKTCQHLHKGKKHMTVGCCFHSFYYFHYFTVTDDVEEHCCKVS